MDRVRQLFTRVRPVHLVAASALAVVLVGAMGLRAVALPGPRPVLDGDRMSIEVVAPVEPEVAPGEVMDVGELVDGYRYVRPPRPEPIRAAYAPEAEWDSPRDRPEERPRSREYAVLQPPPQPEPPRRERDDDRWFGFDAPERDYRAEREMRRSRMEARREEEIRRGPPRERQGEWRRDGRRDSAPPPRDYSPPPWYNGPPPDGRY